MRVEGLKKKITLLDFKVWGFLTIQSKAELERLHLLADVMQDLPFQLCAESC